MAYPDLGLTPADQQELLADFLPYADVVKLKPVAPAKTSGGRFGGLPEALAALVDLALQGGAQRLLSDREALRAWAARRRHPAARQLCAISDLSAWIQALSPSQREVVLC
ncbi:hypothetical protein [Roseateles amylovorans]|uniref:Uncharacterized protein n=1 Tax=Roseateles amylovorans TaxID=2978473 RepID=A0ABY6B4I9_9BURK|nr:hypothetical protein [Roseateles amylovorans]UXH78453.1 hypothetical protein N4261_00475 [Roseateles amylovorans]